MNKKVKIPLIIIAGILFVLCLVIDGWYIYIKYFSGEKTIVRNTFYLGMQTLADGETKKPFIELSYHTNLNGNGLELFEVKYNYLMDENKENFFSQGLQYVGTRTSNKNNSAIKTDFNNFTPVGSYEKDHYKFHDEGLFGTTNYYYHYWFGNYTPKNVYNYQSLDDYETVTLATNPIGTGSTFMVDIDGSTYMMKFKDSYKITSEKNYVGEEEGSWKFYVLWENYHYYTYYAYMDYNYINKLLFESIQSLKPGTNQYSVFEFGDLFDYYVFNEDTSRYELVVKESFYDEAKNVDSSVKIDSTGLLDKIYKQVNSYFSVKVNISENGAQRASDSLLNCINGTQNYVLPGLAEEDSYNGYFVGNSLITLTIDDFEDTFTEMGILLSLTETTRNKYYPYRDKIKFVINIVDNNSNAIGIDTLSLDGFNYEIQCFEGGA